MRRMSSGLPFLLLLSALAPMAFAQDDARTNAAGLRCSTIQLLAQNGEPLKFQLIKFERQDVAVSPQHPSKLIVSFQLMKRLKTDSKGEIRLPQLQSGVYHLTTDDEELTELEIYSSRSPWQPTDCSQALKTRQARASTLSPEQTNATSQ